jgi:hypothetical protein
VAVVERIETRLARVADRAAVADLQQAMHTILRLAGERCARALVMPALGVGRDRARNDAAAAMAEKHLIHTHMGLALHLRNDLLRRNYALLDDAGNRHPDEASAIVIEALWRKLKRNQRGAVHPS